MTICPHYCAQEDESRDKASPGPVKDDEYICRGAYDSDLKKEKPPRPIRAKALRISHLRSRQLSVWRAENTDADSLKTVADKLRLYGPKEQKLERIGTLSVERLRKILHCGNSRAICVLDECQCTKNPDDKDPAHAHMGFSCSLSPSGNPEPPEEAMLEQAQIRIQSELIELMNNSTFDISEEQKS